MCFKSGILFVTGTDDNFIYAIDSKTGEDLWSFEMKASGSAPPIIYEIDGKEPKRIGGEAKMKPLDTGYALSKQIIKEFIKW
mgnify:CR=1 FL=1